ncbi:MAG: GspH/FimT family pseudopilin [Acidobacteria bacterium]|nr:GspH/FimT family pseudopilin [Acidobacteriota bacterium]
MSTTTDGAEGGASLAELLIVLSLIAIVAAAAVPGLTVLERRAALMRTAQQLAGLVARGRAQAVLHGRASALVFERAGDSRWRCYLAEDGDGDGVNHADIRSGRDPITGEVLQLATGGAGPGILRGTRVPDPAGQGWLWGDENDPIRAGRGDIVTFKPAGTATPSSIYLSDGRSEMRVLRVYGPTARVRSLVWRRGWQHWRKTGL